MSNITQWNDQMLSWYLKQPHSEETLLPSDINLLIGVYNEAGIEVEFLIKKIKETIYQHYPLSTIEIEQQ
jgi:hypothetical protein